MEHIISAGGKMVTGMVTGYMGFDESLETLKGKVHQLCCQAADIKKELMEKESGGQRKRKREVESWLQQVDQLEKHFKTFSENIPDGGSIMEKAQKATKAQHLERMTERVEKLRDDGRSIGELTVSLSSGVYPLIVDPLSGKTSQSNLKEIYRWLGDENVRSIGVYGMGGVGKTTLVKHIYNQMLQNESHFNVYWVTVSQDFDIRKLQNDIIKTVGLQNFEENEEKRAANLRDHLVKNKVVLILDDVWDNICLEKLGVPLRVKGCKLILTTRSLEVCYRIGCQNLLKINVLNKEEGWNLFKEILIQNDHTVLTDDIEKHAKELAKKCGGLPLALNTVAASMRGVNDDHTWRNAINNFQNASLQSEDLEKNVFEILKFSYNRLNDQRLKDCFLYCCLYPEDHQISKNEVVMKLIAEGLCEDGDEGHSMLSKLVKVFLLEGGEWKNGKGYIEMHDLMREMALKMSKFRVKYELIDILEEPHWIPELERVSLMRSKIKEIPDDFSPRCPNLSTLILQNDYYWFDSWKGLRRIPDSFLSYMTQLRVLDLSNSRQLECLPNSISNLENLCGLFLQYCVNIDFLPSLEKLSTLRVLNIEGCENISCLGALKNLRALRVINIEGCYRILKLPQDMECLVNLQCLYMKKTSKALEIPKGVISKLRNLRFLHLDFCRRLQSEEVNCLPDLQEFTNGYNELQSFNTTLVEKLEQLDCYHICVGGKKYIELDGKWRIVYLEGISFKGEIKVLLPTNICCLDISWCAGLNGCIADYFQSTSNLRELQVHNCKEVEWIFKSEQITENAAARTPAFKSLEVLELRWLRKLISVCKGEDVILPVNCTFSSLKHLSIDNCNSIKELFPQALLQNLKNLETLSVDYCTQLQVVIGGGVGGDEEEEGIEGSGNTHLLFPKLKHLELKDLPKLKRICNIGREMVCPSIEKITIFRCKNVKRMPSFLPIDRDTRKLYLPLSFQVIKLCSKEKKWWESLEWHNPDAKHILQPRIKWSYVWSWN